MLHIHPTEVFELRAAGWTLQALGDRYGVTKSAVLNYLRRPRSRVNNPRIPKLCACGCVRTTLRRRYTTQACYYRVVRAQRSSVYAPWRHGQRLARATVAAVYPLRQGQVVHHADGENWNNDLDNLWVFASQAEHTSYHRGGKGRPVWRGDQYQQTFAYTETDLASIDSL